MSTKPNIIFILSDQHNAKVLGHKGHPDVKTPNLDRFASEGVRFDNAITQSPVCTPSRTSFLSGQYCHNHGYYGNKGPNPGGLPSILGHFRRHGYQTGAVGKIHCPEGWVEDDCDMFQETGHSSVGGRSHEYVQYLAERNLTHLDDKKALKTEFNKLTVDGRPSNLCYEDSQDGWAVRRGILFMGECVKSKQPFFLHIGLDKPHQPSTPAKRFWDLYDEPKLTLPPNAEYSMEGKAPHLRLSTQRWRKGKWVLFEPKTFEAARMRKLHGYLGNVSQVDHAVGELFSYLDDTGLAENTIVIYSSDHGDYACEHGIMEKAPGICSDAITRIPYIWRWGNHFKAGHVATEIVEAVDVSVTLCSLAEISPFYTSDGKNIKHLLHGGSGEVHKIGVTEFPWSRSVRKGKYRFIYYPPEMFEDEYPVGFGELYDIEDDPWEIQNLYFDADYVSVIQEIRQDLLDWLVTTTRVLNIIPTNDKQVIYPDGKLSLEEVAKHKGGNHQ